MTRHISSVTKSCFFHLRQIRQIKSCLNESCFQTLVQALVISRLDYCNSVLVNLPDSTLHPYTTILHSAARLAKGLKPRDHVSTLIIYRSAAANMIYGTGGGDVVGAPKNLSRRRLELFLIGGGGVHISEDCFLVKIASLEVLIFGYLFIISNICSQISSVNCLMYVASVVN